MQDAKGATVTKEMVLSPTMKKPVTWMQQQSDKAAYRHLGGFCWGKDPLNSHRNRVFWCEHGAGDR
jgi:hypothetical protein